MNRILIVEDEVPIAQLIEMSLARAGYQCEAVNDGCAAADKIEQNDYDLVLLDIMLPGLDGYELLEYLRPMGTPVIFITAKGTLGDRVRGLNLGADDYIVKPFEVAELVARVESVLRRTGRGGHQGGRAGGPHAPGVRPSGTAFAQPGRGTVPRRAVRACLGRRDG